MSVAELMLIGEQQPVRMKSPRLCASVVALFWKLPSSSVSCAAEGCSVEFQLNADCRRQPGGRPVRQRGEERDRRRCWTEEEAVGGGVILTACRWFCPPDPLR